MNVWRISNVSGAATNFAMYHPKGQCVAGEIIKVEYGFRNAAANGSFLVQVSGTNELIDSQLNLSADAQSYPTVYGTTGSPNFAVKKAVYGELMIVGSSVGATSGLSYVNVFWK